MKDKKITAKFCPSCKSFNVKYVFGLSSWLGMAPKMRCKDCSFEMPSFPVLHITEKELEKKMKSKKKVVKKAKTKGGKK